jgi:Flp pilus assembly protein CpaB
MSHDAHHWEKIMRRAAMLLVIVGLTLAVVSTGGVFFLLQQESQPIPPTPTPVPMVKVVVAAQDIPERASVKSEMLQVKDWPKQLVPANTLYDPKDAIGATTSSPIAAGELIMSSKLAGDIPTVGLAPSIPAGLVAIVVSLPPAAAAAGGLKDGDAVDVLVSLDYTTYNESGGESKPLFVTFYTIQDVRVLHVGAAGPAPTPEAGSGGGSSTGATSSNGPSLVTLTVTPQDALLIKYAKERGNIDVVLRSPLFHEQVVTDPVYLDYIMRRFDLPRPVIIANPTPQTGAQR